MSCDKIQVVNWITTPVQRTPLVPKKGRSSGRTSNYNLPSLFNRVTDFLFDPENVPERISGTYTNDYDIMHVHDVVLYKINHEKKELGTLIQRREGIKKRLEEQLKIVERRKLEGQLEEISRKIEEVKTESRRKQYLDESKEYLEKYQQLGPIVRVKSFNASSEEDVDEIPDQEERLVVIKKYLDIAKKYIPINVVRIIPNDLSCPGCGQELVIINPEDASLERCEECGFERINLVKFSFTKDSSSGQSKSLVTSDYEDEENFLKVQSCYLGEQSPPSPQLFAALDEWARKYDYPTKEEIREMPLNEDGSRGPITKSMLFLALGELGYAENYKDIRLIGHLQWGWRLPVLSQQEREIILQDYRATQKIFNSIKKGRKSSLNAQLRLYRHLEARGIPCQPSDFKLPTTPGILEEQDEYWKEMIKAIPGATFRPLK
jgi:hypothetical protein